MASDATHHAACNPAAFEWCRLNACICWCHTITDADREAAELLPCLRGCGPLHMVDCPVAYRPAVAAKLRERDEKLAAYESHRIYVMQRDKIAALEAESRERDERYERLRSRQPFTRIAALEAERDALRAAIQVAWTALTQQEPPGFTGIRRIGEALGAALAQRPKP